MFEQRKRKGMKPRVSIVIPVYNGVNYLAEAIDSALAQTYENCEVIVVNDGSTDETEEIALSYGNQIRYFMKPNGGVASALNLGIKKMTGDYFAWLSHDDVYYPDKIETQINALERDGDMEAPLYGNWDILQMPEREIKPLAPEYRFSDYQLQNGVFPVMFGLVNGCTVLIHKSHFERVGLFDEELITAQDVDMWFRIFRNRHVVYVDKPLIKYRFHDEQGSKTIEAFQTNCQDIQLEMIESLEEREIEILFGGKYKLYFDMMMKSFECAWEKCLTKMKKLFVEQNEPTREYTYVEDGEIVLYCAGKNGCNLKRDLELRAVPVKFFSDSNPDLWGTIVQGCPCIKPELIPKTAWIIITKDNPEQLESQLFDSGYYKLTTYKKIAKQIYASYPNKDCVVKYIANNVTDLGMKEGEKYEVE